MLPKNAAIKSFVKKEFSDLDEFKWDQVISELLNEQQILAKVLLDVCLPTSKIGTAKCVDRLVPVVSTIYGILMKTMYQELTPVQKIISMTLANEQAHQKVYVVSTVFCWVPKIMLVFKIYVVSGLFLFFFFRTEKYSLI